MNKSYLCEEGCSLPSSTNKYDVLIKQLKDEIDNLVNTTEAKLLDHDGKIAELCKYVKDNLSNTIICLLDSMKLSGELDNIIQDAIILGFNDLEKKVHELYCNQKRLFRTTIGNNVYIPNTSYKYDNYDKYLKQALKTRFDDIILVFHIEGLNQVSEDINLMKQFRNELVKNNINCNTKSNKIKFDMEAKGYDCK